MRTAISLLPADRPAPDFTLPNAHDQNVSLSELRGGPVILAFYPADWSPVCGDQMTLYQAATPEFARHDAIPLGISVDSVWSHRAFADHRGIRFPLLADFQPKGAVAARYGAYDETDGVDDRVLYVIDPDGVVFWSQRSPRGINPGVDGILAALEAMSMRWENDGARIWPHRGEHPGIQAEIARRQEANQAPSAP
jgi:peroxiredoxin